MAEPLNIAVTMQTHTCYSGHVWAGPHWARSVTCPYCAGDRIDKLRVERDSLLRAVSSLRGQITKLRKARRG